MIKPILFLLAALAASAHAAELYKCRDAQGRTSYQSAPCAEAAEQVWVRDTVPEAVPPKGAPPIASAAPVRPESVSGTRATRRRPAAGSGGGDKSHSAACRAARKADADYRRKPLRLVTHDGLRRHGDAIQQACY